jgi:hypothetical protein
VQPTGRMKAVLLGSALICAASGARGGEGGSAWFVVEPHFLSCSPKTLRAGQSLVLTLGPGHGKEMAIRRIKDRSWYSVISYGPAEPGDIKPPLTSEEFAVARRLEIPSTAKALLDGGRGVAPIFSKPGRYTVYVSDNLDSEDPGYRCEFTFAK